MAWKYRDRNAATCGAAGPLAAGLMATRPAWPTGGGLAEVAGAGGGLDETGLDGAGLADAWAAEPPPPALVAPGPALTGWRCAALAGAAATRTAGWLRWLRKNHPPAALAAARSTTITATSQIHPRSRPGSPPEAGPAGLGS
jgi:hypothetical protein